MTSFAAFRIAISLCLALLAVMPLPAAPLPQGASRYKTLALNDHNSVTFYQKNGESAGAVITAPSGKVIARFANSEAIGLWAGTGVYRFGDDSAESIVLLAQVGGKTLEAFVYRWDGTVATKTFSWSGWSFKGVAQQGVGLIAVQAGENELTDLYFWRGSKFVRCNTCFPEFYEPEIKERQQWARGSGFPAYFFTQSCAQGAKALVYGRRYDEAKHLCDAAMSAVANPARLIPSVVGSQEVLHADQSRATAHIKAALDAIRKAKSAGVNDLPIPTIGAALQ